MTVNVVYRRGGEETNTAESRDCSSPPGPRGPQSIEVLLLVLIPSIRHRGTRKGGSSGLMEEPNLHSSQCLIDDSNDRDYILEGDAAITFGDEVEWPCLASHFYHCRQRLLENLL